jgi:hypothetical protein
VEYPFWNARSTYLNECSKIVAAASSGVGKPPSVSEHAMISIVHELRYGERSPFRQDMACAVVDDVTAWCLLAVVVA